MKDAGVEIVVTLDLKASSRRPRRLFDGKIVKHVVVERFRDMLPGLKGILFSLLKRKDVAFLESRFRRDRVARPPEQRWQIRALRHRCE